ARDRLDGAATRADRAVGPGGRRPRGGRAIRRRPAHAAAAGQGRLGGRRLMAAVSLDHALVLAAILFAVGFAGLLTRRNLIAVLAFVAAGARWGQADGQVMFLFVLAMAAAEVAVGLAIAIRFRQSVGSLDVDDADEMRG